MSTKRKRVVLTIEEKLIAIKRIINAADLGVGVSRVSDWVKVNEKIGKHCSNQPNQKTMKPAEYEKVNEAIFLWFTQQREKGTLLSGPIIQENAKVLAEKLGEVTFAASNERLDRWKSRYGMGELYLCGEKLTAGSEAVNTLKAELKDTLQGYTKDQIFNAAETGLNYQMLPTKPLPLEVKDQLQVANSVSRG